MDREIQELLQKVQQFTNDAVKELQKGNKERAAFFFDIASSYTNQISAKLK